MDVMRFQVCRHGNDGRWIVRCDDRNYGDYLDKDQALLDALDAARDAQETGRDAQVWLRESASDARIL